MSGHFPNSDYEIIYDSSTRFWPWYQYPGNLCCRKNPRNWQWVHVLGRPEVYWMSSQGIGGGEIESVWEQLSLAWLKIIWVLQTSPLPSYLKFCYPLRIAVLPNYIYFVSKPRNQENTRSFRKKWAQRVRWLQLGTGTTMRRFFNLGPVKINAVFDLDILITAETALTNQ